MNKTFHQLISIATLHKMEDEFQKFILSDNFTEDKMKEICDYPDLIDHDNIENDPLCKHDHSWKLAMDKDNKLYFKDGNAISRVKNLAIDVHDFNAEKNYEMVKYSFSKMTHYIVDSQTFPHNFVGFPWNKHHEAFEIEMGKYIDKHFEELEKMEVKFIPCKDVYKYCTEITKNRWQLGKEVVDRYEQGIKPSDQEKMEICISCLQAIGDVWTTIAKTIKLI